MTRRPRTEPMAARLGRLLDEHGPGLVLFARQWCSSPEDVVQDALLRLVAVRRELRDPVAWLYRVVRNRAISVGRSERRRRRRERAVGEREPGWFDPSYADAVDAATAARELRALPDEQRAAVVARIWGGLTFAQMATALGCSSSAAHRRYAAGLGALRERLGVRCTDDGTA